MITGEIMSNETNIFKERIAEINSMLENEANTIAELFSESKNTADYKKMADVFGNELFEECRVFSVANSKTIPDDFPDNTPGIYVFVITPESGETIPVPDNFNDTPYAPNLSKKREYYDATSNKPTDFRKGQVLYLGKSESDLKYRLNQHINEPSSSKTYALKLSSNERTRLLGNLTCVCFVLKEDLQKYGKTILPAIESHLHDKLLPRVGSKRS